MKFAIKLLGICVILALTQPLFAQGQVKAGRAIVSSALHQTEKTGADAILRSSQVGVKTALQTSQIRTRAALQTPPLNTNIKLRISSVRTSVTLQERVKRTYKKALEVQKQYPDLFIYGPMDGIGPTNASLDKRMPLHLRAKSSYPNAPFLAYNPKNLTNYFLAQENRHIIRLAPQFNALEEEWRSNIKNFEQSQIQWDGPKEQEMHWLAGEIPLNTSYLLLGEVHRTTEIHTKISQLLQELRLQQPQREIILLTECWPKSKIFRKVDSLLFKEYAPIVWQTAKENDISVVGLELAAVRLPEELESKINVNRRRHSIEKNPTAGISIWSSLEGIRLRNANWLATIQQLRQKHPNALFVVYAGNYHIRGWNPFSLSTALNEENTFTVSFILQHKTTWFDKVTENQFDSRVLSFRDKHLRELFGADVQIRVQP